MCIIGKLKKHSKETEKGGVKKLKRSEGRPKSKSSRVMDIHDATVFHFNDKKQEKSGKIKGRMLDSEIVKC